MKMIIKENEAGFLMKNGVFVKMLFAGKHHVAKALGYELFVETMEDEVEFLEVPYQVLAKNKDFAEKTVRFQIPDGQLGLIYVDGQLRACANRREYVFWNEFEKHEIRLISMEQPEIGRGRNVRGDPPEPEGHRCGQPPEGQGHRQDEPPSRHPHRM